MGRDLRYILPNSLQHVVDVIYQNRYLLCPSDTLNDRFLGILGKAQATYGMTVCAVVVLSNHYHLLLRPRDAQHLAEFMCFLKTNLAKEIGGRLRGWKGTFFHRRYHATTVSDEDAAQIGVLRYLLSHGVKEGLVESVHQWPGIHSARHLVDGTPLIGHWYDRSGAYRCRKASERRTSNTTAPADDTAFRHQQFVHLSPLPCWEHLSGSTWRPWVEEMVQEIDRSAAEQRRSQGSSVLGVAGVLAQDPRQHPEQIETSPQPRFHVRDRKVLERLLSIWRGVVEAYVEASERLRSGERSVVFPEGTFPPSLSFVPFSSATLRTRGHPI